MSDLPSDKRIKAGYQLVDAMTAPPDTRDPEGGDAQKWAKRLRAVAHIAPDADTAADLLESQAATIATLRQEVGRLEHRVANAGVLLTDAKMAAIHVRVPSDELVKRITAFLADEEPPNATQLKRDFDPDNIMEL